MPEGFNILNALKRKKASLQLTEQGKKAAEANMGNQNSRKIQILNYLSDNGNSTTNEIAEGLKRDIDETKILCKQLIEDGYIAAN